MNVNSVGRVLHHPTALPVALDDLSCHRLARGRPEGGVRPQEQHRFDLAGRVHPPLRDTDEEIVDRHQPGDRLLLVVERGVLLLVRLLQEFR